MEQLVMCIQDEYLFYTGYEGFKWGVTNSVTRPTDTALGTTTHCDRTMAEDKNLAGVRIVVQ